MKILVRGSAESGTENYSDRIVAALSAIAYTHFDKEVLVMQLTNKLSVERVLAGKATASNIIGRGFSFKDSGMDALWKRIRLEKISPEEWKDCTKTYNKLSIAEVSDKEDFSALCVKEFETTEALIRSAEAAYDVVFILAYSKDEELISLLKEKKLIDKELVCIEQGPAKKKVDGAAYIVKNFDFASEFSVKKMCSLYGTKAVYPFPYNIGYKDACLNEMAITFLGNNAHIRRDNVNYEFIESVMKAVGSLIGVKVEEVIDNGFVFDE